MSRWLYEQEMEQLIGLMFKVRNELGGGWSEEIYHQALAYLAQKQGIPIESKPRDVLLHRDVEVHTFEPDLIAWDKIILELKVLLDFRGREFPKINQAQLFHYLKFRKMQLGALVNFAHSKVGICRLLFNPPEWTLEEDYAPMMLYVNERDKEMLREVQKHIKAVARQYGLGYPETVYRAILTIELNHHAIPCKADIDIVATLNEHRLGMQSTSHILVADKLLLQIRTSADGIPAHDFTRTRSYLKALGLQFGWLVNFGRSNLQIFATSIK